MTKGSKYWSSASLAANNRILVVVLKKTQHSISNLNGTTLQLMHENHWFKALYNTGAEWRPHNLKDILHTQTGLNTFQLELVCILNQQCIFTPKILACLTLKYANFHRNIHKKYIYWSPGASYHQLFISAQENQLCSPMNIFKTIFILMHFNVHCQMKPTCFGECIFHDIWYNPKAENW